MDLVSISCKVLLVAYHDRIKYISSTFEYVGRFIDKRYHGKQPQDQSPAAANMA
jgi:hypothetical protein